MDGVDLETITAGMEGVAAEVGRSLGGPERGGGSSSVDVSVMSMEVCVPAALAAECVLLTPLPPPARRGTPVRRLVG